MRDKKIKNIYIYISDSLRWDYLPRKIRSMGITYKTIAQSIFTCTSIPSIITGLNPPRHRVFNFFEKISEEYPSLFDMPLETSYWGNVYGRMSKVLNNPPRIKLEEISEPFIFMELSDITHTPFDKSFKNAKSYRNSNRRNQSKIIKDYNKATDDSCKYFLDRLNILKKRNILDDTLCIFTSDHGEILNEYGFMSHIFPVCPETVYVPTVFIGPDIPRGEEYNGIIRHIDILPTISYLLDLNLDWYFEGKNIIKNKTNLLGFNYYVRNFKKITSASVWNKNNGFVKLYGTNMDILLMCIFDIIKYTHSLDPIKYSKRKRFFGDHIKDTEQLIEEFLHHPTFTNANNIKISSLSGTYNKDKMKLNLYKKIQRLKRKL